MADKMIDPATVSFEELLKRSDLKHTVVRVPRWDIDVEITELSADKVQQLREASLVMGEVDNELLGANLIAASCVSPHFTLAQVQQLGSGKDKSQVPLRALIEAIQALNGMGEQGRFAAESSFPAKG